MNLTRALMWNVGTYGSDVKEEIQVGGPRKDESTEAEPRGGVACSSEEGPVMGLERRGGLVLFYRRVNQLWEEPA